MAGKCASSLQPSPLHCLNFRIFSLSTQWFGSKCGGWVNQANLCCIYAFTITIMFIVVCRAQHVASVARELQCWRNCFNVFSMQSALRNAAAVVSLLSFSLEHGSFAFFVVDGTLKLYFNQKTILIAKIDELKNKKDHSAEFFQSPTKDYRFD